MPTGGPKDTIPPVVINVLPANNSLNVDKKKFRIFFDEYVTADKLNEKLVVSPPQKKRPSFRLRGKSLELELKDSLRPNTTYSIDFQDAIVDNNEKNPLEHFRIAFSTGDHLDSLAIMGYVLHAENMERYENCYVLLHKNTEDSAFVKVSPDYIGKTDEEGRFTVSNIAAGKYAVYALEDLNRDLKYNAGLENMAFLDSLIVPSAKLIPANDTIVQAGDTIVITEKLQYFPKPFYMLASLEKTFNQYLDSYKRLSRHQCQLVFVQPTTDVFEIELLDHQGDDWCLLEKTINKDTINIWLADTVLSKIDSLDVALKYIAPDSLSNPFIKHDTLTFYMETRQLKDKNRKKKKKKQTSVLSLAVKRNIGRNFDLNRDIDFKFREPISYFDTSMIKLYLMEDSIGTPVKYHVKIDTTTILRQHLCVNWQEQADYRLVIDSAAIKDIYGVANKPIDEFFNTQKLSHYGTISMKIANLNGHKAVVHLIKTGADESPVVTKYIKGDTELLFDYLHPGTYKLKLFVDNNGNGKWDSGSFSKRIQPERIFYYDKEFPVRSNWDLIDNPTWVIDYSQVQAKPSKKEKEEMKKAEKEDKQDNRGNSRGLQRNSSGIGGRGLF